MVVIEVVIIITGRQDKLCICCLGFGFSIATLKEASSEHTDLHNLRRLTVDEKPWLCLIHTHCSPIPSKAATQHTGRSSS